MPDYPMTMRMYGPGNGDIIADEEYPNTPFLRCQWSPQHDIPNRTMAMIRSTYNPSNGVLVIHGFYSKNADERAWQTISDSEKHTMLGRARILMVSTTRLLPSTTHIQLDASGGFPWDHAKYSKRAASLSTQEIESTLDEHAAVSSSVVDRSPGGLRIALAAFDQTEALVAYYQKYFGFQLDGFGGCWDAQLSTTLARMRAHMN